MLGLALATSNVPSMYRGNSEWQAIYQSQLTEGVTNEFAQETDEVVDQYISRIDKAMATPPVYARRQPLLSAGSHSPAIIALKS